MNINFYDKISLLIIILLFSMNCAPVTSDMQSAKTTGQGGIEITLNTGSLQMNSDSDDDEMLETEGSVQDNLGGSLTYGVTDKIDAKARYESIKVVGGEDIKYSLMSFGIKYGIIENKLAFYLPYSSYNTDQDGADPANIIAPTLLYTTTFGDAFELTPSIKYLIPVGDTADVNDPGLAYNLGFGYNLLDKFTLRGEWGRYIPNGDNAEVTFSQMTFGLTYKLK